MPTLAWTDELRLQHAQMDRTHEEFIELLAAATTAWEDGRRDDALSGFDRLHAHTVDHFGQEDRWMQATGFAPENCHTRQHEAVVKVMREAARLAREVDNWEPLGVLLGELAQWFPQHIAMMDAGLAMHLRAVGFDAETGTVTGEMPAQALTHCGGASCS